MTAKDKKTMMESPAPAEPWAKVRHDSAGRQTGWHSLLDHSTDVAACFGAVLRSLIPASRLARLAGRERLPEIWIDRLCALAALHDFGKANAGFQARWDVGAKPVGHCREALAALCDRRLADALFGVLPLAEVLDWGGSQDSLYCMLAHHGRPLLVKANLPALSWWRKSKDGYDPVAALKPLGDAVKRWSPDAFSGGGEPLPDAPRFWHAALGYLTFADWLGSDVSFFPFANGAQPDRISWVRERAMEALRRIGFDPGAFRTALVAREFSSVSPHPPCPAQLAIGDLQGRLAILEAETGSDKTEGALWRFARLFAQGEVDGLYLALPTRVAALAMRARVVEATMRLFPDPANRPRVTLAVPGMADVPAGDDVGLVAPAPDATESVVDSKEAAHWAAERPKRFLAGTVAVGTIDQALLGAIRVKHAHLRAACLLRHLLVVDEAHASDRYMNGLLEHLLKLHVGAGGHALLLSATLGASARVRFLGDAAAAGPTFVEALAVPYPALWSDASPRPAPCAGGASAKSVAMTLCGEIGDPDAVARRVLAAATAGAKVLVIRNLRRDAVATFEAVLAQGGADWLMSCRGVPALHHGRFAREDRALLDGAVEAALGRTRPDGGRIAIGTQTLEINLDLDSDFLITDLCPADVLLQRLGRLHRHRRARPAGFETPRATVLSPADLTPFLARGAHGMGVFSSGGETRPFPYPDLLALEATRRLVRDHETWTIPAMNRLLVESATHDEAREALLARLAPADAWRDASNGAEGRVCELVRQANYARLRYDAHFDEDEAVFPEDESFSSRLGARDLLATFDPPVTGPFGAPVSQISIPDYGARGLDPAGDLTPKISPRPTGGFAFEIQGAAFIYDRLGLARGNGAGQARRD